MFKDFSTSDKTTFKTKTEDKDKTTPKTKTKTEDKDILVKINNKIDTINRINEGLAKVKIKVTMKIESVVHESVCELQDEIYSDDS